MINITQETYIKIKQIYEFYHDSIKYYKEEHPEKQCPRVYELVDEVYNEIIGNQESINHEIN